MQNFKHVYSLQPELRYYYQSLTVLNGDSIADAYHFIIKLKSIQSYNQTTGKLNPFNFFYKTDSKAIADLLGLSLSTFKRLLKHAINKGWVIENKSTYNIVSIDKINSSLKFKPYTDQHKREYYSYTKLDNAKGIDLNAHRIHELIKQSYRQFKYQIGSPNIKSTLTSSANHHLVNADLQLKKNKVKTKEVFAISMDTISDKTGYSKNQIQLLINKMTAQGLEVVKDKSKFTRYEKRVCNKYNVNQHLTFVDAPGKRLKKNKQASFKKIVKYNDVELLFQKALNNTQNRIDLIAAGILSRNYLKFTKKGLLVSITKRSWSNILIGILSDENLKESFLKYFKKDQINIIWKKQNAMFSKITDPSERYGEVSTTIVELVRGNGNYDSQYLRNYKTAVRDTNDNYLFMVKNDLLNASPYEQATII